MKIVFLGVGEACDEMFPNTSIWIQTKAKNNVRRSILLDCGPTVPPLYFSRTTDPEDLDALWISHFHADHFFGIPTLLLRFREMKRQKTLIIVGQSGTEPLIHNTMSLAYPGFLSKLTYPLSFEEVEPEQGKRSILGLGWQFAENGHGQRNLALRLEDQTKSVFYSGDGYPGEATVSLAMNCDLIIHEAFDVDHDTPGHSTVQKSIEFARTSGAQTLALVHVQRDVRKNQRGRILEIIREAHDIPVLLPEAGEEIEI
jgi:ribonuclease Z